MAEIVDIEKIERRVLLLTPTIKDGAITRSLLAEAGLDCLVCKSLLHLSQEIKAGASAALLTEALLTADGIQELLTVLHAQPSWSDLPLVMLMHGGADSPDANRVLRSLRNVTLLERPAPMRSVLSAVQAAVRARQRQYQIRSQIEAIKSSEEQRLKLLESERAARGEAERASRMKDEFLTTLSHELRTPLNAIFGWSQLLKNAGNDRETVEQAIEVIDRNVKMQSQLISDLLDVSRIVSGKVRLEIQAVNLAEIIEAAIEGVRPAAEAKGIRLETVLDPQAGPVSGDPGRIQQVLWNLLTNAIKFTPRSGKIQVLTQRVNSQIEVSVSDTGEGIEANFLPYLFDRFSQADSSSKRKHGGLGLGLSIVKSLVEVHGGTVRANSPGKGQGATFTISLPIRAAKKNEEIDAPHAPSHGNVICGPTQLQGVKVLVVDDEPDSRELVRRLLVECEAEIAVAATAKEATDLVQSFSPDVILSDIGMPYQDGYEFMREIRQRGITTPAVALTAFARAEDRIRSIQAGYQSHLPKPVEPSELLAVVASLAGRFSATN
jgi:signal transduction histidine kinase